MVWAPVVPVFKAVGMSKRSHKFAEVPGAVLEPWLYLPAAATTEFVRASAVLNVDDDTGFVLNHPIIRNVSVLGADAEAAQFPEVFETANPKYSATFAPVAFTTIATVETVVAPKFT